MKIITTGTGEKIKVYSQGDEMDISRYNKFQKYLLIESGIGHTMDAIDGEYSRMVAFMLGEDVPSAIKEAENKRHCVVSILNEINYLSMAFACMVFSVGDTICDDTTEEGINATVKLLEQSKITMKVVIEEVESLKKK